MKTLKLLGFVLLLPLLLGSIGFWQSQRIGVTLKEDALKRVIATREITALQKEITRVKAIQAREPNTVFTMGDNSSIKLNAAQVLMQLDSELSQVKLDPTKLMAHTWQQYLAGFSVVAALLALVVGSFGLLVVFIASLNAMRSRGALLRGFNAARGLLPLLIVTLTMTLGLSFCSILIFEALASFFSGVRHDARLEIGAVLVALAGFYTVFRLLWSSPSTFKRFRPEPLEVLGQRIAITEAPDLWAFIKDLAKKANALEPEHIIFGLTDSFYVTSGVLQLMPSKSVLEGRTLHLPLHEVALLSQEETAAIIGHELGHFSGQDTEYSQRFIPIYAGVSRNMQNLAEQLGTGSFIELIILQPSFLFSSWFMERFDIAVQHWSRQREFAADQVGIQVAGATASASALIRVAAIREIIGEVFDAIYKNPSTASRDFIATVLAAAANHKLTIPLDLLEQSATHPTDTHPPTSQRLEAMGVAFPPRTDLALLALRRNPANTKLWLEESWFTQSTLTLTQISEQLSTDLLANVLEQDLAYEVALQEVASQGKQEVTIYENTLSMMIISVLLTVLFAAIGGSLLFSDFATKIFAIVVLGVAAFFAYLVAIFYRRGRDPVLHLSIEGLQIHKDHLIPWKAVRNWQTLSNGGIHFILESGFDSTLKGGIGSRGVFQKKTNTLKLIPMSYRKLQLVQVFQLIHQYQAASLARAELVQRQVDRSAEEL